MRRVGATLLLLLAPAAPAVAQVPAPAPEGGAQFRGVLGEAAPSAPVARVFRVAPGRLEPGARPRLLVRVDQPGARSVRARIVFWPQREGGVERLDLGRVRTARLLRPKLPRSFALRPGRYLVRLHVRGRGRRALARSEQAPGRARLIVVAPPPPPEPKPPPTPAPPPPPPAAGRLVFPVAGPYTLGDGIGADRGDRRHEGQDILAAEGVPVVAPIAGIVSSVAVQGSGAGHYVVLDGADGRGYFFAHCRAGSTAVVVGDRVGPGARLCEVGTTGRTSGPHLHFEIWVGGWRRGPGSRPVDPLPELRAAQGA